MEKQILEAIKKLATLGKHNALFYGREVAIGVVFGKYGSPHEFIKVFGHFRDGETIKPHRVY
ncbi:MAG: hypothetical protein LBH25_04495 [Fibromonadaceae bacterium]|jgi:hypothetical protein|nr:hypothetical protein [Fibromonadaceae bacterium]